LKNPNLTYDEKVNMLEWFVDQMRNQVLNFFAESEYLKDLDEVESTLLLNEIEKIHKDCQNQLFKIQNDKALGNQQIVTADLEVLFSEINDLSSKLNIIELEKSHLKMIREHNSKVDMFAE